MAVIVCAVLGTGTAMAQQPLNLLPPSEQLPDRAASERQIPNRLPQDGRVIREPRPIVETLPPDSANGDASVAVEDKQLLDEPSPSFQPIRPADQAVAGGPNPAVIPPQSPPQTAAGGVPLQPPLAGGAVAASAAPVAAFAGQAALAGGGDDWPVVAGVAGMAALLGALMSGLVVGGLVRLARRGEVRRRRQSVASVLATELETRHLAFETVPLPPNAEAGVSFVSAVTSLAGVDAGFRAVQSRLDLLPDKLAAHVSVHYAAVQRVSDFVKGQSLAAAVRMLQANRLGGHPCPDAGSMRDAHVELAAAFRGLEKVIQALRSVR